MQEVLDTLHQAGWTYIASKSIEIGYPLLDVNVVTCSSHYNDLVHLAAVDSLIEDGETLTMDSIIDTAIELADDINIYTTEKISIVPSGITAFINVDVIDATCIPLVCHMVQIALSFLEGEYGDVQFSKPMQFLLEQHRPHLHLTA